MNLFLFKKDLLWEHQEVTDKAQASW
jgi:hypothetical protein